MSIELIEQNPYRVLGLLANSSKKEREANLSKIKAFAKLNRPVSFDHDFEGVLPAVVRDEAAITQAKSALTLPEERMHAAQFWFVECTQFDTIALNHLKDNDLAKALDVASKGAQLSALQNSFVLALIAGKISMAIHFAERLYTQHLSDFVHLVLGDDANAVNERQLTMDLFAQLEAQFSFQRVFSAVSAPTIKDLIADKRIMAIGAKIEAKLADVNNKRKAGKLDFSQVIELLDALKALAKSLETDFAVLVGTQDVRYKSHADSIASEANLVINTYWNNIASKDEDFAEAAEILDNLKYFRTLATAPELVKTLDRNIEGYERAVARLHVFSSPQMAEAKATCDKLLHRVEHENLSFSEVISILEQLKNLCDSMRGSVDEQLLQQLATPVVCACYKYGGETLDAFASKCNAQQAFTDAKLQHYKSMLFNIKMMLHKCLQVPIDPELRKIIDQNYQSMVKINEQIVGGPSSRSSNGTGCLWLLVGWIIIGFICFIAAS